MTGNPLAVSCTLNVLTVIMYEFKKEVPAEVYSMILENVLILMSSAAREILKATVSFLITLTKESFSIRNHGTGTASYDPNEYMLRNRKRPYPRTIWRPMWRES